MISFRRTGVLVVIVMATVAGYTDSDRPAPGSSSTPSPSAVALTSPELRPGHRTIASGGPRRGDWDLGSVQLGKGVSWVNVNCVADTGTGRIELSVDTVGEFTIDCPSTEARISVNQLDLSEGRKGRFHIEAADSVRWMANIQVPD
ncbi:hypothetical protein [Streptomyces yaizuensis]|uniref:Secreted protein n=1 Tax=Streptomyces yaizuensis TaxID=2989713 RepID=A0ABQ5PA55_9ACTN|nr:hypothetical protein [Streptomyces sp. YSPA8]GLF99442.1 hypothetical protein SYYSPA8_34115 [Streptomyces sp. YSPA8]